MFEGKETEGNWQSRDRLLADMTQVLGGESREQTSSFIQANRQSLETAAASSLGSARTQLVLSGCAFAETLVGRPDFDESIVLVHSLLKLAGSAKRLVAAEAGRLLQWASERTFFPTKFIAVLAVELGETKNVFLRLKIIDAVLQLLFTSTRQILQDGKATKHLESCLRRTAGDASPEVRYASAQCFLWLSTSPHPVAESRLADEVFESLDPSAKKQLSAALNKLERDEHSKVKRQLLALGPKPSITTADPQQTETVKKTLQSDPDFLKRMLANKENLTNTGSDSRLANPVLATKSSTREAVAKQEQHSDGKDETQEQPINSSVDPDSANSLSADEDDMAVDRVANGDDTEVILNIVHHRLPDEPTSGELVEMELTMTEEVLIELTADPSVETRPIAVDPSPASSETLGPFGTPPPAVTEGPIAAPDRVAQATASPAQLTDPSEPEVGAVEASEEQAPVSEDAVALPGGSPVDEAPSTSAASLRHSNFASPSAAFTYYETAQDSVPELLSMDIDMNSFTRLSIVESPIPAGEERRADWIVDSPPLPQTGKRNSILERAERGIETPSRLSLRQRLGLATSSPYRSTRTTS